MGVGVCVCVYLKTSDLWPVFRAWNPLSSLRPSIIVKVKIKFVSVIAASQTCRGVDAIVIAGGDYHTLLCAKWCRFNGSNNERMFFFVLFLGPARIHLYQRVESKATQTTLLNNVVIIIIPPCCSWVKWVTPSRSVPPTEFILVRNKPVGVWNHSRPTSTRSDRVGRLSATVIIPCFCQTSCQHVERLPEIMDLATTHR